MSSPDVRVAALERAPCCLGSALEILGPMAPVRLSHQWPAEPNRPPSEVRLGHFADTLHVLADLPDSQVFSKADGPNQPTWTLGDAFEIFLQVDGEDPYVELHVTPNGHRLQLRFPSEAAFRQHAAPGSYRAFLLPEPSFGSAAALIEGGWQVWAAIPAALVAGNPGPLAGQKWRFSFCRYDYDDLDTEPRLSSSSDHGELDFHRTDDWGLVEFESFLARAVLADQSRSGTRP